MKSVPLVLCHWDFINIPYMSFWGPYHVQWCLPKCVPLILKCTTASYTSIRYKIEYNHQHMIRAQGRLIEVWDTLFSMGTNNSSIIIEHSSIGERGLHSYAGLVQSYMDWSHITQYVGSRSFRRKPHHSNTQYSNFLPTLFYPVKLYVPNSQCTTPFI